MSSRAQYIEGGSVLVWPTSGMSEQDKIAEALAIADAKRSGQPYATKSGVNLGVLETPEQQMAREGPKGREKAWRKPRKTTEKRARTAPASPALQLSAIREQIRRLRSKLAALKAPTPTKGAARTRSTTPSGVRRPQKPPIPKKSAGTPPETSSKPSLSATIEPSTASVAD